MDQYHQFLQHILDHGEERADRTGVGTLSTFGYDMRFDISKTFPMVTTKKLFVRTLVYELLWFLRGEDHIGYLREKKVGIWDHWADANGHVGPIYGVQWRSWPDRQGGSIDQIAELINNLRQDPHSRRHIICAWNVADLPDMALPPCHCLFQFYLSEKGLSCKLTQRSADVFLGVPYNIASYSLLTYMIAHELGVPPHEFIWSGGDCHLYLNHLDLVREQLQRPAYPLPTLSITPGVPFADIDFEHIHLENYQHHPFLKAEIAV